MVKKRPNKELFKLGLDVFSDKNVMDFMHKNKNVFVQYYQSNPVTLLTDVIKITQNKNCALKLVDAMSKYNYAENPITFAQLIAYMGRLGKKDAPEAYRILDMYSSNMELTKDICDILYFSADKNIAKSMKNLLLDNDFKDWIADSGEHMVWLMSHMLKSTQDEDAVRQTLNYLIKHKAVDAGAENFDFIVRYSKDCRGKTLTDIVRTLEKYEDMHANEILRSFCRNANEITSLCELLSEGEIKKFISESEISKINNKIKLLYDISKRTSITTAIKAAKLVGKLNNQDQIVSLYAFKNIAERENNAASKLNAVIRTAELYASDPKRASEIIDQINRGKFYFDKPKYPKLYDMLQLFGDERVRKIIETYDSLDNAAFAIVSSEIRRVNDRVSLETQIVEQLPPNRFFRQFVWQACLDNNSKEAASSLATVFLDDKVKDILLNKRDELCYVCYERRSDKFTILLGKENELSHKVMEYNPETGFNWSYSDVVRKSQ